MGINFTDFSKAPLIDSPFKNIFEDVLKGYKIQQEPRKMAQEKEQKRLANAIQAKALEHADEKWELEKAYKTALKDKANRITTGQGKASGDFNNFMIAHPNATAEDKQKWFDQHDISKTENAKSLADRRKQIMNADAYRLMPSDYKKNQLALAAGLGIETGVANQAYESGKTFTDLAKEQGVDPRKVVPVPLLNNENAKQYQTRVSLISELLDIENNLKNIQGKYSRKFLGYSPKQMVDALKNKNPDEQGMILAARNLGPEVAAIRAKIATNGTIGIEALRELMEKSLSNLKVFEPLVSEEARNAMDKYTNQLIISASQAYGRKLISFGQVQPQMGQETSEGNLPPNPEMANALNNNQPGNQVTTSTLAPEIPSWVKNSSDFKKWKDTLNPQQIEALRKAHLGE